MHSCKLRDKYVPPLPRFRKLGLLVAFCALALQACATSSELVTAREQFKFGYTDIALQTLDAADVSVRDRLLLHLDKALVAQAAEQYEQSIIAFEEAYKLIDELDYVSVRDQSAALVSNDWAIRYAGEISERLWIHTFQMINFLMLDRPDGAAVEARRAVLLFDEHDDVLNEDVLTRYLMALSFESAGQLDSAGVEYRKLEEQFGIEPPSSHPKNTRELVLLVASGFIQPKMAGDLIVDIDARIAFPFYPETYQRAPDISIVANKESLDPQLIQTRLLPIARSALAKRGKSIAARQALRLAAKNELANQIADEDALAGGIAQILLFVLEQADTRSWETLPAWLSLARVAVPADISTVNVHIRSEDHQSTIDHNRTLELDLQTRLPTFELIRIGVRKQGELLASP